MKTVKQTINPLRARILLKRLAPEKLQSSTIVIPETVQGKSQRFEVLNVGSDVDDIYPKDVVILGQYAGTTIEIAGQEVVIVNADEVLATIDE